MKRNHLGSLTLTVAAALVLSACGKKEEAPAPVVAPAPPPVAAPAPAPTIRRQSCANMWPGRWPGSTTDAQPSAICLGIERLVWLM